MPDHLSSLEMYTRQENYQIYGVGVKCRSKVPE